jgi:hypothetical protein
MSTQTEYETPSTATAPTKPEASRTAAIGGAATDAAVAVKGVATDAAARLPEVAATTRTAIEETNRQMRQGSDEMLAMGSALAFGLAGGLLIGGAPRLVVAAAMLPAGMMVMTLLDRASRTRRATGRAPQGG